MAPAYGWPLRHGTTVTALEATCDCGAQFFACPECGMYRCLRCDPIEVDHPEKEPSCHAAWFQMWTRWAADT